MKKRRDVLKRKTGLFEEKPDKAPRTTATDAHVLTLFVRENRNFDAELRGLTASCARAI